MQQWLASHLGLELQLLAGTYVLVPAHDIPLLGKPHLQGIGLGLRSIECQSAVGVSCS
jgi:hypothetical protein